MTLKEAAQQALEALTDFDYDKRQAAITALRQALEQADEPVAWRNAAIRVGEDLCSVGPFGYYDMTAEQWLDWALSVVTVHPPQREWVGLTDEEVGKICGFGQFTSYSTQLTLSAVAHAIEAKLKEKNT